MQARLGDLEAVRQEIPGSLCQQMKALTSPAGLADEQLRPYYLQPISVAGVARNLQAASVWQEREDLPPICNATESRQPNY